MLHNGCWIRESNLFLFSNPFPHSDLIIQFGFCVAGLITSGTGGMAIPTSIFVLQGNPIEVAAIQTGPLDTRS